MVIRYFGHSAVMLKNGDYEVLIDPYLKGNPNFDMNYYKKLKPDYILVSHGHGDHVGDTVELAKRNNSIVIAPFELSIFLGQYDIRTHPMHIGGSFNFYFGIVKLTLAAHGSAFINSKQEITYTGNPCGFIIHFDGKTFYFAGDTGLFLDMKLIGEMNKIDYAFLPIGDNFTMGIDDAVKAVEFLKPKNVIPIHYNTFDAIKADPKQFERKLKDKEVKVEIIGFNDFLSI